VTDSTPLAQQTLERLARTPTSWTSDAKCIDAGVDMMEATREQMEKLCGRCTVREQCLEGAHVGEPVRAGARGGEWLSYRTKQQP
jgi:hypothetical protein